MRLVMMGTGPFAVPTFRGLYETHHTVAALVTGPLRGRGPHSPGATPMRAVALEHGTPIYDPEDSNTPESQAQLASFEADLLIVCDYGQILSVGTLATARLGGINLHASLLPKFRGAAPINWALYFGEKETGVSVIHMTPQIDAGPVIAQGSTLIDPEETAVELEARLAEIGAWLVRRAIDSLEAGILEALPQDPALASRAPRLKKTDGLVDWSRPAAAIKNQVRALEPWPKTYTFWHRSHGAPVRLILGPVTVVPYTGSALPGTILEATGDRLVIATGEGAAKLESVQPAGKRLMVAAEILRGYHLQAGERLGPEEGNGEEGRRTKD
ncbi:MAG: methionyl-tRNA formyltransferase [Thermoguttaceae bacterium]|jgi:methionyl-tRNA formyltransferase